MEWINEVEKNYENEVEPMCGPLLACGIVVAGCLLKGLCDTFCMLDLS